MTQPLSRPGLSTWTPPSCSGIITGRSSPTTGSGAAQWSSATGATRQPPASSSATPRRWGRGRHRRCHKSHRRCHRRWCDCYCFRRTADSTSAIPAPATPSMSMSMSLIQVQVIVAIFPNKIFMKHDRDKSVKICANCVENQAIFADFLISSRSFFLYIEQIIINYSQSQPKGLSPLRSELFNKSSRRKVLLSCHGGLWWPIRCNVVDLSLRRVQPLQSFHRPIS